MVKMTDEFRKQIETRNTDYKNYVGVFLRTEVDTLLSHIKTLEWELECMQKASDHMEASNNRAAENIVKMNRQLEEAREGKKVALPREVAEALQVVISQGNTIVNIIYHYASGEAYTTKVGKVLADFASDNFDLFLSALVNSYTVEEEPTTEDKLRERALAVIKHWWDAKDPTATGIGYMHRNLADQIVSITREVLAEERKE